MEISFTPVTSSRLLYFPPTKLNCCNSGSGIILTSPDLSKILRGVANIYRTLAICQTFLLSTLCATRNKEEDAAKGLKGVKDRKRETGKDKFGSNPHICHWHHLVIGQFSFHISVFSLVKRT